MIKTNNSNSALLVVASFAIIAVTLMLYYPSLNYDFMWDDTHYLGNNVHIQKLSWENIKWMLTAFEVANWHPLTWLSFAIDYAWQGSLNPWGFHLTNIILHSLNCVIIFFVTSYLLNIHIYGLQNSVPRPQNHLVFLAALITALLFGIHPQHIESVAWISERKDVLCQFFLLFTVYCYISYTRTATTQWYWFLFSIILFILALMSKPMAVTLPVVLLLLDVYPLRRTTFLKTFEGESVAASWRLILIEKIPFFTLSIASIILTLNAQDKAIISVENFSLLKRIINAIHSVFLYMSKFVLPIALSPLYPFPKFITQNQGWIKISVLIAGFILITVLAIYYWRKNKNFLLIIWIFYLVTLSPVIGIIQVGIQSAADRYAYLPTLPFYILIGSGAACLYYKPRKNFNFIAKTMIILGIVILGSTLFKLSRDQLQIWKHGIVFWNYVITINPSSSFAQHNLAAHYFHQKSYQKALEHVHLAVLYGYPLRREYGFLGEIYIRLEKLDEALNFYQHALKTDPTVRNYNEDCVFYNIGWIYANKGLFVDALQALDQVPKNSKEFSKAQNLATKILMLDTVQETDNLKLRQIPLTAIFPDAKILYQARLDHHLTEKNYSLCSQ